MNIHLRNFSLLVTKSFLVTTSFFLTIGSLSAHFPTADCFVIGLSFYCRNILLGKPKRMLWQWSDEKTAR